MKKIIILVFAVLAISFTAAAQPRAIGIRNGEFSYQHSLGDSTFAEIDLGYSIFGASATAMYDFFFAGNEYVSFYIGPGLIITNEYEVRHDTLGHYLDLGAGVQFGCEYAFEKVPINLSADVRPAVTFFGGANFRWYDIGLSVRYRF